MTWAKLDDGFYRHPKSRAAGKDGRALFVAGLCWSASHLLDGLLADTDLALIAAEAEVRPGPTARRLVEVGFWHRAGHTCERCAECPDGHYLVHDYDHYQEDATAVRERKVRISEERAKAGRKGAAARWGNSKPVASAMANGQQTGGNPMTPSLSLSPTDSRPPIPNGGTRPQPGDNPWQGGGVDVGQAVQLAATRYARHQVASGRAGDEAGLARWWLQENDPGATTRAHQLLVTHDLTTTQLADALVTGNPSWLDVHRRPTAGGGDPPAAADPATIAELAAEARRQLRPQEAPTS